jgi:NADPH2:quinone reductase
VIAALAAGGRFREGDRVVFLRSIVGIERDGTLAESATVPAAHLARIPEWWSPQDGAAGPHVLLTAWQALHDAAKLRAGDTVLISGASGGIGTAALILAKAMGATVIALSRSPEKRARLLELGADHALESGGDDLAGRVHALGGADVVVDSVGGDFLPQALEMANPYARICVIGALGCTKSVIDPTRLIFKRLQVHGILVALYSDEGVQEAWHSVQGVVRRTQARIPIDSVFPFGDVPQAFERLRRGPMGKVVIGPIGHDLILVTARADE